MERAATAREAILLMGSLAEEYGFYGAGSFEGTAESLLVSDPEEGWIFHILPDDTGTSAIWAAQRVPDDHVAVVPNVFVIREVPNHFENNNNKGEEDFAEEGLHTALHTPSSQFRRLASALSPECAFLGSKSVHSVAVRKKWWSPDAGRQLDFTGIYSDGEYAHKFYSGRRVWGVYRLLAPQLDLPPNYTEWRASRPYPTTAPSNGTKSISLSDVFAAMRTYYEGTQFDQTQGKWALAGGPWSTPDHAVSGGSGAVKGNWERTVGLFRTSDSYAVVSNAAKPAAVIWWGAHSAAYTVHVPFLGSSSTLPDVTLGHPAKLEKQTLFWGVRTLYNLAQLRREPMMESHVRPLQRRMEQAGAEAVAKAELLLQGGVGSQAAAAKVLADHASRVVDEMRQVADEMLFMYADGYVTTVKADGSFSVEAPPYPDWWLRAVGYQNGPPPVPAY